MKENNYCTNSFLEYLANAYSDRNTILTIENPIEFKQYKVSQLAYLLKLDEKKLKLEERVKWELSDRFSIADIIIEKYTVFAITCLAFPIYIIRKQSNNKCIMYLHGHDTYGVSGTFDLNPEKKTYHKNITLRLAEQGYVVIAPDLIGYGECVYEYLWKGKPSEGKCSYHTNFLHIYGLDLAAIRTFQVIRSLDWCDKMGMPVNTLFGMSGGGLIASYVSAVDDRIQNTIIHSYTNTYKDSILAKEQCIDNYVHGINEVGDNYEIVALSVPKKMLLINGDHEIPFPLEGTKKAFRFIRDVYDRFDAGENLSTVIFNGGHEICVEEVQKWLNKTL